MRSTKQTNICELVQICDSSIILFFHKKVKRKKEKKKKKTIVAYLEFFHFEVDHDYYSGTNGAYEGIQVAFI